MTFYGVLIERTQESWLLSDHWFATQEAARTWAERNWHGFPIKIATLLSDVSDVAQAPTP